MGLVAGMVRFRACDKLMTEPSEPLWSAGRLVLKSTTPMLLPVLAARSVTIPETSGAKPVAPSVLVLPLTVVSRRRNGPPKTEIPPPLPAELFVRVLLLIVVELLD